MVNTQVHEKPQIKTSQNAEINILKFIFAYIIFFAHFTLNYNFGLTYAGYIVVDYFFVLSGIFLHRKIRHSAYRINPLRYIFSRYLHFLPYILYTFVVEVIIRSVHEGGLTIQKLLQWIWDARWELLCLYGVGLKSKWLFYPPLWFISSLLLMSFLICIIYWFAGAAFDHFSLIVSGALYLYLFLMYGHTWAGGEYHFLFTDGTWRALAGLCLGLSADQIVQLLTTKIQNSRDARWCAGGKYNRVLRIIAWLIIGYCFYFHRLHSRTKLDFWFIPVMTAAVIIILILEEPAWMSRYGLADYAGKLSLPIYFNHNYLMEMSFWLKIADPLIRAAVMSVAVFLVSAISLLIIEGFGKLLRYSGSRFCRENRQRHI